MLRVLVRVSRATLHLQRRGKHCSVLVGLIGPVLLRYVLMLVGEPPSQTERVQHYASESQNLRGARVYFYFADENVCLLLARATEV